jgi:hypothetical protein
LDKSDENKEAIERMRKYLSEQEIKPKANNEKKMLYSEQTLF